MKDFFDVHCRTGSLETFLRSSTLQMPVHCRTGSLENPRDSSGSNYFVHCRTGSLETLGEILKVFI